MAKKNFKELADAIVTNIGGEGNVKMVTHCVTRLRFILKDESKADTEAIKKIPGVMTVVKASGQYQVVIGNDVVAVYNEVTSNYKMDTGEVVNEDNHDVEKPKGFKAIWAKVMDYVTGTMSQLLPVLITSGMISVILALATSFFGMSTDSNTYRLLNAAYDAGFYYLPIFVGIAAAKKLKANPFVAGLIGAVLVHPNFLALVTDGGATVYGIPFTAISYAKSVIPMLLITFVMAYVETFMNKWIPGALKFTFVPLCTFLIMLPLALVVFGPLGYFVGSTLVNAVLWVYSVSPFLIVPLTAVSWPLLVMFGAHTLMVPTMTELISTLGYEPAVKPGAYCSNFAQLGVLLAVAFKSEKHRAAALSAASSCIFGVTEPAMYGVILPRKKTMISMILGSLVGGFTAAFLGVKAYTMAANSILSIIMFGPTMIGAIISVVVSVVAGFGFTLLIGFDEN